MFFVTLNYLKHGKMVTVLKQGENKKNMRKLLEDLRKNKERKGINAQKYCGTIKLKEDALSIQKRIRDEWH